ncbi:protein YIPF1 isoform X2 [Patella vulgata]|uniref:protein YIPF1 isoform X2 n=1 Tax=Patella vulgata TaxID=6465 RepID=UPI00217FEF81|nr:protein YIPF1 isoform X2 [Patella vulgata]
MASNASPDVELGLNDSGKNKDELQFQDFPLEDEDVEFEVKNSHIHKFSDFPPTAESDEDDSTDKSELLKEDKKTSSFWTFEYYQQYFDVDSKQVLHRIAGSMIPLPGRNYLVSHIRPNPDLYGPFWICMTLVFTIAISGNLANYLQSASTQYEWKYDFHKVSYAATAIFSYWWLIPLALYGLLWWRGTQSSLHYTFLEIICVYGYSLAIYVPISILWMIQVNWLQWLLVTIGAVLSGSVLLITFWPVVKEDAKQVALTVMALIFIFNAALAVGFVLYFFHVPNTSASSTIAPTTPNVTLPVLQHLHSRLDVQANNIEQDKSPTLNPANSQPSALRTKVSNPTDVSENNLKPAPVNSKQSVDSKGTNPAAVTNAIKPNEKNEKTPQHGDTMKGNARNVDNGVKKS